MASAREPISLTSVRARRSRPPIVSSSPLSPLMAEPAKSATTTSASPSGAEAGAEARGEGEVVETLHGG